MRGLRRAMAAAVIALVAGCGSDGGDSDDGKDTAAPPPPATTIAIVAGDPAATGSADGAGASARFNGPRGIAVDAAGNLYVADQFNSTIRKITPAGQVSTLAGSAGLFGRVDSLGSSARLARPAGLSVDPAGDLLFTDELAIRKSTLLGQVTTLATIPLGGNIDSRSIGMFLPGGVAGRSNGDLFVTTGIGTRLISASGTVIVEGVDTMDNVFGTRSFVPRGITIDGNGNVYVADLQNSVSKIETNGRLTTVAGRPGATGSADGTGSAATFASITALATDKAGNLYAADSGNNLIRKITPAGVVTTVAGTRGSAVLQPGPLPGSLAAPAGIAVDRNGVIFATSGNAVIRIGPAQ